MSLSIENIKKTTGKNFPDRILTVDSHTGGETTRLIVGPAGGSLLPIPGRTMREKLEYFKNNLDRLRLLLTREPRGNRDMLAAALTEPVTPGARFGLIYMDARRYPFLCGHATVGAVASLIQCGALLVEDRASIVADTPSGPAETHVRMENGRVEWISMDMPPSFVYSSSRSLEVEGVGELPVDLVCVGGFFAMIPADRVPMDFTPANHPRWIELGMKVIEEANKRFQVRHPERPEVKTIDVAEFYEPPKNAPRRGKNLVVYGESHIDRSPCGTGTAAKLTLFHKRGLIRARQKFSNAGPLDTTFKGEIVRETKVGDFDAVVVRISAAAHVTGIHEFFVMDDDPFPEGFLI